MTPSEKFFREILEGKITSMIYLHGNQVQKDILPRIREELDTLLNMGYKLEELGLFCNNELHTEVLPLSMCEKTR